MKASQPQLLKTLHERGSQKSLPRRLGHWALGKQVTSSPCPMPHSPCPKTPTQEWVEFFISGHTHFFKEPGSCLGVRSFNLTSEDV
ncbi:hypothetical protein [Nostoc sp.]|uniref:hypothetical protein n=1 Tax=Nostoc sp. TaxID=1180 RepID=UPI002FFCD29A